MPDGSTLSIFHFVAVVVRRCKAAIDGNRKFNRGSVEIPPVSPVDPACWVAVRGMVAAQPLGRRRRRRRRELYLDYACLTTDKCLSWRTQDICPPPTPPPPPPKIITNERMNILSISTDTSQ